MDPAVAAQFSAQLIAQAQSGMRAHDAYLATMGHVFLSSYAQTADPMAGRTADLNTASHAPTAQPFVVPNFVAPPKAV